LLVALIKRLAASTKECKCRIDQIEKEWMNEPRALKYGSGKLKPKEEALGSPIYGTPPLNGSPLTNWKNCHYDWARPKEFWTLNKLARCLMCVP
jgi:hypothetical protein